MANTGIGQRSQLCFNAGELSPLLHGRVDLDVWQRGCKQLQNMLPRKYGNAEKRQGLRFIHEAKDSVNTVRLLPFLYSVSDSVCIEMSDGYFRFFKSGAIIESGGSPYEVAHPYSASELFDVQFMQLNDVMFFTHPDHPPYKLSRYSDVNWAMIPCAYDEPVFMDMNATDTTIAPSATTGNITLTASAAIFDPSMVGGYFKLGQRRTVTNSTLTENAEGTYTSSAISIKGKFTLRTSGTWAGTLQVQRQDGSTWVTIYTFASSKDQNFNQELAQNDDDYNSWRTVWEITDIDGAPVKAVIETEDAYFYGWAKITGYTSATVVSATVESAFFDTSATKYWAEGAWSPYRGYPAAVAYFQDRVIYGGTYYQPQTVWGSVTGDYYNFEGLTGVITVTDDMAFAQTMGGTERLYIRWMKPLGGSLIAGTSSGEFSISGTNGGDDPLTATNVLIKVRTSTGNNNVPPVKVGESLLHVQRDGLKVYEMTYDIQSYGFSDADITQFSEHITEGGTIIDMAFQKQPDPVLWCVRSDGMLLACVYDQAQKVVAWSRMVTQGSVESVSVIYGDNGDELWCVVKRTLGSGTEKKYIERLYAEAWETKADCYFVDSAALGLGFGYLDNEALAPIIATQPVSTQGVVGSTVSFTVVASTTGGDGLCDYTYQWMKDGEEVSGGTGATLSMVVGSIGQAGSYSCIVSCRFGSVESIAASLLVSNYFAATEHVELDAGVYFSDTTSGVFLPYNTEEVDISSAPHFLEATTGVYSGTAVESASLSSAPYFYEETSA